MRKILIVIAFMCPIALNAGNEEILAEIEANNLSLKALRAKNEALGEVNLAEATLSDPNIEFAYLWGQGGIGRKDISVSQSFDYATISGLRRSTSLKQNELLAIEYKLALREVLLEARNLISEIIYHNALIQQYDLRLSLASQLEAAYKEGFEKGVFSIIDYRNASLELAVVQSNYNQLVIEKNSLLSDLAILNGGKIIEIGENELVVSMLPGNFTDWLNEASSKSSSLEYYRNAVSLSEKTLQLSKSEAIPSLSVGYVAELVPESNFRGIQFGLNIPLWSSGRKIKAAKKQLEASKSEEDAAIVEFGLKAKKLYNKALLLSSSITYFSDDIVFEIEEALNSGQIDIFESISSINEYYNALERNLMTKLNYVLTINELISL